MLRIKKEVDLKELNKYGFREIEDFFYKPKKGTWEVVEVKINKIDRIIDITGLGDLFNTKEDTLYDLITAGIVEKVEEE